MLQIQEFRFECVAVRHRFPWMTSILGRLEFRMGGAARDEWEHRRCDSLESPLTTPVGRGRDRDESMALIGGLQAGSLQAVPTYDCPRGGPAVGIQDRASDEHRPFQSDLPSFRDPVAFCCIPGEPGVGEALGDRGQFELGGSWNDLDPGLSTR
jgi:hypothetical protein